MCGFLKKEEIVVYSKTSTSLFVCSSSKFSSFFNTLLRNKKHLISDIMINVIRFCTAILALLTASLCAGRRQKHSRSFAVSSSSAEFRKWAQELSQHGGTVTHAQAAYREQLVVQNINAGLWPVSAYHEYQIMAAGSGNVDSARLFLEYALLPVLASQEDSETPSSMLRSAILNCDTHKLSLLLDSGEFVLDEPFEDGNTPLALAALSGCTKAILSLISEGVDLEAVCRHGLTAVMVASTAGQTEAVTTLAESGASLRAQHRFAGTTALHMAAELGHAGVIQALCARGADIHATTTTGGTPLHIAAQSGAAGSVQPLLAACGANPNALMNGDTTALYLASLHGHDAFVTEMIKHGADVSFAMPRLLSAFSSDMATRSPLAESTYTAINSQPGNGAEAIHAASENGHAAVVRALLSGGADINSRSIGVTPLHLAVQYNRSEVASLLLQSGAEVDLPSTIDGSTPLYYAAGAGLLDTSRLLIAAGASPLRVRTGGLGFPLLYAALRGRNEVLRLLLRSTTDVNYASPADGLTALLGAASSGYPQCVSTLLRAGADVEVTSRPDAHSALHLASMEGHVDVMRALLQHMSSALGKESERYRALLNRPSGDRGFSALHYAAANGAQAATSSRGAALARLLVAAGADINSRVTLGRFTGATALYIAASIGSEELTGILLENGADPDISLSADAGGYNALIAAIDKGFVGVAAALLGEQQPNSASAITSRRYADPNKGAVGSASYTQSPLLLAVVKGLAAIVSSLLSAGADCSVSVVVPKRGIATPVTLLEFARIKRDYSVMQILSNSPGCEHEES
jgi:ankyrin repeat protein